MHPSISDDEHTGTTRLQEETPEPAVLEDFLRKTPVYWHPLNSREKKFQEWLDPLAVKNSIAFRETLLAARAEQFLADHAADWEQTKAYVQKILAAVAVANENAAAQWLAEAKIRAAKAARIIERDGVRIERAVLIDRGVYRGR